MMKRIFAMVLAVCMTLTLLPVSALAARSSREDQPLAEVAKGEESLDRAEAAAAKPAAEADAEPAAEAEVNGVGYASLQKAVTAVYRTESKTGTVKLLKDITVAEGSALTIWQGCDIVLDMNGKTLNSAVYNYGTLTITGDGKITTDGRTDDFIWCVLVNAGTLTIENGTFEGDTSVASGALNNGDVAFLQDTATATIKSGTFLSPLQNGVVVINDDYPEGKNIAATLKIEGGTFQQNNTVTYPGPTLHNIEGTVDITGGEIKSVNEKYPAISNGDALTIGGSAKVTAAEAGKAIDNANNGTGFTKGVVRITGGEVTGDFKFTGTKAEENLFITGGTFSADVSAYVANNADVETVDGVTTVTMPTEPNWETHSDKALWLKESNAYFGANEMKALLVEANKLPSATVFCKPDAQITSYSHMHVTTNLTVYGNNATVTGGEQDFELDTYDDTGRAGTAITKDITLHVENLHGIAAWGQRHSAHTLDLEFVGCQDMNRVYFTGTTGTNNIKLTNCGVNETVLGGCAVYSNAPGEITLEGCTFDGVHEPINLNHKSTGEQYITVKSCTFTNCNSGTSDKLWAAPIRVLSTVEGGSSHLTVDSCTFTNSGDANGDILLGEGRTGNQSYLVTAEIKNTAAEVQIQNPGDRTETTNNSEKVTVAATETAALTNAAAEIDGVKYTTLQAALTAANATEGEASRTVTLLTGDAQTIDLSKYADGLTNVTLTAAEGVTVTGIAVRSAGSMSGVTFRGIDFNATDNPCVDFELNDNAVENITFDDCSFTSNGQQMAIRMYRNTGRYQNITVTNCEFNDCSQGVYAPAVNTLAVSGCTFNSVGIAVHPGDVGFGGTVSVTNNTFDYCGNDVIAFNNDDGATGTITGNTSTHGLGWSRVGVSDGKTDSFTVSGNTWDGYADGADNVGWTERMVYWGDMYVHYYRVPAAAQVLDAEGQTLYGTLPSVETAVTLAESGQTIRILAEGDYDITGLAENVTVTVPDGYVQKTEGNTLIVATAAAQLIAMADGAATAYATVAEALAASNPGDTLKLLAQPEGAKLVIPDDKAVQIDKNGFDVSIQSEAEAYGMQLDPRTETFRIYGGFYQVMEGEAALRNANVGTAYGYTFFALNQDLTLTQDVTLPMRNAVGSCISVDKAGTTVTLDLAGHTITQTPGDGINSFPAVRANYGNLVITDSSETEAGKIIGAMLGAQTYDDASLTLESGTISTLGKHYGNTYGSVVYMFGGTFNMTGGSLVTEDIGDEDGIYSTILLMTLGETYTVNISGGMIQSVPGGVIYATANTATENTYHITGGTFDLDLKNLEDQVGNSYLDAGYCTAQNQDGTYTVGAHALTETAAKPATCTEAGNTAYWSCNHCGKLFSDAQGATEIQPANTVIAALGHNTNGVVQHKAPTCTEAGVVGGTYCTNCEEGKQAALAPIPVDPNAHDLKWSFDETNHWHECSNCDYEETHAAHAWVQGAVSGGRRTDTCECGATRTVNVSTGGNSGSRPSPTPTPDPVVDPEPQPPEEDLDEPDVPLTDKPFLFTDVKADDWFYDAVKVVAAANIMVGVDKANTTFAPMQNTTRGTVATLIHRMEETPDAKLADFSDVLSGAWYTEAVNWTDDNGVMIGFPDGTFRPEAVVTREQLVLVFYRYAKFLGYDVSVTGDLSVFADVEDVSDWAEEGMAWAVRSGLIQGRGGARLAPQGTTTRGELATMLCRFLELNTSAEEEK